VAAEELDDLTHIFPDESCSSRSAFISLPPIVTETQRGGYIRAPNAYSNMLSASAGYSIVVWIRFDGLFAAVFPFVTGGAATGLRAGFALDFRSDRCVGASFNNPIACIVIFLLFVLLRLVLHLTLFFSVLLAAALVYCLPTDNMGRWLQISFVFAVSGTTRGLYYNGNLVRSDTHSALYVLSDFFSLSLCFLPCSTFCYTGLLHLFLTCF
jgi:hypothetical protein